MVIGDRDAAAALEPVAGGLDPLPLGAAVLEPDLNLDFGEPELVRDRRAFGQREVLLGVELAFQFRQLHDDQ